MSEHRNPPEDCDCIICYETITSDNYVEYRQDKDSSWNPSLICIDCIETLIESKMKSYLDGFFHADCRRAQLGYLNQKPPTFLTMGDITGQNDAIEIKELWIMKENKIISARVRNAFSDEMKQQFIEYYTFLLVDSDSPECDTPVLWDEKGSEMNELEQVIHSILSQD